jgi:DNA invertase Pin-like site-specific DNA recombinase
MIVAMYARKSTGQNAADEEKSVTRQVERARAYATAKGWTVDEAHVHVDDGISGAEFIKRPGFLRLMNALRPRAPFQALIMSEESRLGREQIETAYALKQIMDAGVRVFFYLEGRERTLDNAMDKVMLLVGRLIVTPRPDEHVFEFRGEASYGGLLAGLVGVKGVVPPG